MSGQEQLLDLLVAEATVGLTTEEQAELQRLMDPQTELDREGIQLAAAIVDVAFQSPRRDSEPLPGALKQRILADARVHLRAKDASAGEGNVVSWPESSRSADKPGLPGMRYLGWYAAAAMLLLAIWSPWTSGSRPLVAVPAVEVATQRSNLIASAPDLVQVEWGRSEIEAYSAVAGDVVWSNEKQAGFMRLIGIPPNDRALTQYQLWIVDPTRDEHPIDGGVFDVPAGVSEWIVPIDAKLEVASPAAFAITLEQSGGVVVSDGPLLIVASVQAQA